MSKPITGAGIATTSPMAAGDLPILRFLTCGSVDDGKSTLIGRLLYDTKLIEEDSLQALEQASRTHGTTGSQIDLALLLDGLQAERQQGITIDVAYRCFTTPRRKFIVADTPGHEQYTRNMVTGASHCDVAVILVDARKGIVKQTRRHTCIVDLLGIRNVVLAINKMDLVDFAQDRFDAIEAMYRDFVKNLAITEITALPLSALMGDNVVTQSPKMGWYGGPTLLDHLESVNVVAPAIAKEATALRMPVQWICRPDSDFRGYAGTIVAGQLRPGVPVVALPSLQTARISRIIGPDADLSDAGKGDAVVVTLDREIDVARGDVLCSPSHNKPEITDQFTAHIIWMGGSRMLKGRSYILKLATQTATAQVSEIKYLISMDTLEELASRTLELNDVAVCNLTTNRPLVIEPYADNRHLGGFILIDRTTNETVAAGMILHGLRRAHNIQWQKLSISKADRRTIKGHLGCCLWFTGFSGAGKSTVANELEKLLFQSGVHTYILDGDNVRHGLNRDLGFTDADRVENIRRVAEVARLMVDAGLVTIVSFISPFRAERRYARELFETSEFLEVFIDTPIEVCERRDPKGLYRKARSGEITNFTGIGSPYEPPLNVECHLLASEGTPRKLAETIVAELVGRGIIPGA